MRARISMAGMYNSKIVKIVPIWAYEVYSENFVSANNARTRVAIVPMMKG